MSDTHDPHGQEHARTRLTTPGFVQLQSSPMDWKSALKLMAIPIVLVGIGAWLALAAWRIFPRGAEEGAYP
jgi:hypothetical protein